MKPPPPPHRVLSAALKDVHNRGAALFNAGDHAAARRLFEGGLRVVVRLLADFPAARQVAKDGLAEVDAAEGGDQLLAFRLHELIDQVRLELKAAADPRTAGVSGTVALDGRPADGVCVMFYPPAAAVPVALAVTDEAGRFAPMTPLVPGEYAVALVGRGVPDAYQAGGTTPLAVRLVKGANAAEFAVGHS